MYKFALANIKNHLANATDYYDYFYEVIWMWRKKSEITFFCPNARNFVLKQGDNTKWKVFKFQNEKKESLFMTKTNLTEWIFNISHIYTYDTRMR